MYSIPMYMILACLSDLFLNLYEVVGPLFYPEQTYHPQVYTLDLSQKYLHPTNRSHWYLVPRLLLSPLPTSKSLITNLPGRFPDNHNRNQKFVERATCLYLILFTLRLLTVTPDLVRTGGREVDDDI